MFESISQAREPIAPAPAIALRDVRKVYGRGDGSVVALDGVSVGLAPRVVHRHHGAVGLRQEHVPARGGGAGPADLRHASRSADTDLTGLSERRLTILQARADRVRLPGLQPDAVAHGRPEHRPAAAPGRSPAAALGGARGRGAGRAGRSACATVPPSSPAASSSGSRSPGRSSPGPRWCSPTSRPERWTPAPGARCSRCCARSSTRTATRS